MATRPSVLCIDADEATLQRLSELLGAEFDVSTAATPDLALLLVESKSFEVICADNRQLGITGLDLLRKLAEKCPLAEQVIFTGTKSLFLQGGVDSKETVCYVFKPYKPEALQETIRSLAATAAKRRT